MSTNDFGQPIGDKVSDWQALELPSIEPLQGRFCRIEKLLPAVHSKALYQALCDSGENQNWTYLPYGPFATFESFDQWLQLSAKANDPLFYAIIDLDTNQAVGLASYLRINPAMGVVEIGHIHFSAKLQKTAHASEAMYLMMKRVFEIQGYRRYEWKCDNLNEPSKRAAKRLGFSFEGVFRQALIYKNRNRDTTWYSIIDTEWPALKVAFEHWLDPSNFDQRGKQKTSLQSFREH